MTVYKFPEMTAAALPDRPLSVALGNFDGVHLGHRRLLCAARTAAASRPDCLTAVWTFSSLAKTAPHVPCLTGPEEKFRALGEAGAEYVIAEEFDAVCRMEPEEFVTCYLLRRMRCAVVVCGFNFRFGRGARGDADTLRTALEARGVPLIVVPPVTAGGGIVSSTRIRAAVEDGDMEAAEAMLGRPFSFTLPVLHGKALGRQLGFATLNQRFPEGRIVPRRGVYAAEVSLDGALWEAVADVGVRPTVESGGALECETHILGYEGDLYGKTVTVRLLLRLRGEETFSSLSALREAIENDVRRTRAYFRTRKEAAP